MMRLRWLLTMAIDLCIVTYNNRKEIQRLLDVFYSSLHQAVPRSENDSWRIWIADNGSTDGTAQFLSSFGSFYFADEIFLNDNIGYAKACNQLAAVGDADIIALLNADVWFTARDLQKIQFYLDCNPDVAIVGPKQRNEQGQITHAGIFGTNDAPKHRGWKENDPFDNKYLDIKEAVTVSGSAYFIRRSVWESLSNCSIFRSLYPNASGAFLPTPHYYEETWCSYHAREHGYKVVYNGDVSIGHSWHASSEVGGAADALFRESQLLFRQMCDAHNIVRD